MALDCEKCEMVCKCSNCIGMRYELHWFCAFCYEVIRNPLCDDCVSEVLHKLTHQLSRIEEKLDSKVNVSQFDILENVVKEFDMKVNDSYASVGCVAQTVEKSRRDVRAALDYRTEDKLKDR